MLREGARLPVGYFRGFTGAVDTHTHTHTSAHARTRTDIHQRTHIHTLMRAHTPRFHRMHTLPGTSTCTDTSTCTHKPQAPQVRRNGSASLRASRTFLLVAGWAWAQQTCVPGPCSQTRISPLERAFQGKGTWPEIVQIPKSDTEFPWRGGGVSSLFWEACVEP